MTVIGSATLTQKLSAKPAWQLIAHQEADGRTTCMAMHGHASSIRRGIARDAKGFTARQRTADQASRRNTTSNSTTRRTLNGKAMPNWIDQIRELNELRQAGLLTEEEFEEQKKLLLPSNAPDERAAPLPTSGLSNPDKRRRVQPPADLSDSGHQRPREQQNRSQKPSTSAQPSASPAKRSDAREGRAMSEAGERTRLARQAREGGGPFGRYDDEGNWICHYHRDSWCRDCARLDRLPRGETTRRLWHGDQWTCNKHGKVDCPSCRLLRG